MKLVAMLMVIEVILTVRRGCGLLGRTQTQGT